MVAVSIGNIEIFRRSVDNPYREAYATFKGEADSCLTGDERKQAFQSILKGEKLPKGYEVWFTPSGSSAYKLTLGDILNWNFV